MSETMFYILYSLQQERYGYTIMQYVETLTNKSIRLGAGTVYQSLSKLEYDGLIKSTQEVEWKKQYIITEIGTEILRKEAVRIAEGKGANHRMTKNVWLPMLRYVVPSNFERWLEKKAQEGGNPACIVPSE